MLYRQFRDLAGTDYRVHIVDHANNPVRKDVVVEALHPGMDEPDYWAEDSRTFNLDVEAALELAKAAELAMPTPQTTFTGSVFRLTVGEPGVRCSTRLISLLVEDDEVYHLKATFDAAWIPDLIKQLQAVQKVYGRSVRAEMKTWHKR